MLIELAAAAVLTLTPMCSIRVPLLRTSIESPVVLARATGQIVMVPIPDHLRVRSTIPEEVTRVAAHEFVIVEVAHGTAELDEAETFLAIPWDYDPSCARQLWKGTAWVPAGAEAVFILGAPRATPGLGLRYDMLGAHSAYPYGAALAMRSWPQPSSDRATWLTPREYFDLASQLPVVPEPWGYERYRTEAEPLIQANERWTNTFPGSELLRRFQGG